MTEEKLSTLPTFIFRIETIGKEGLVFLTNKVEYDEYGIEFEQKDYGYFIPYSTIHYISHKITEVEKEQKRLGLW